ncbi:MULTISPECIES: tripartite tricarboxylate transporter permease [unclassified Arthrobacter]|uniref:tripartite tricarboxylate transporter permease n=1 Tax=unclassified Arthrobacter TaxID=235627 RepID=UPI001D14761E|nr:MULTISPECIES: tripartite tricarboxylate transporter permease [unclassified Arthrobacter]MCC3277413.1 tripartite tricarboxylate transporter permease [Arthrobacter sp. zg-Y20]MCC3279991.1 tripartite tricarboxylate transporter permease [Arthrobacter sp. zg-Y40]MCC9178263.1 tripartite tricarboxylate transporter permease [Arthrobacter sp. zg-Y750]MDK1317573.1 tripartite tricarboxylate transporter permease [Arthrobacter sp. zg.Y20]MDK1328341.1 tripartite tricarboxylate transporter permease [Arthr
MDQLALLFEGFAHALTPVNLLWVLIGAVLGTAVGVLPGLGSAMAVALLLPVTFSLEPTAAFIMFAGIYFGGLFGDSTAGILLNTPGNSSAIASTFEGHRMAKNGHAAKALATAAIGAFIGGLIATTLVVFFAPTLVKLATVFGPAEYFALAVFAFLAISAVVSESVIRGVAALGIGLALALVGIDGPSGTARFTLGMPQLFDGISVIVITVGLLALGEVFHVASRIHRDPVATRIESGGNARINFKDFRKALPSWLRGTAFGAPFGLIPAGGAEVPTFLAYGTEKQLAKRRKDPEFGTTGSIKGLAAPEAASNATAGTAMGALLALGLPTSATAAIMLAAFQQYGMQPGPLLFERSGDLVWALLASLFIGLVMLLIINLPFASVWAKLLSIPRHYLYAGITVFSVLGVYAVSSSLIDLWLLIGIGLVGFMMRRYGIPLAPLLIAVILGPMAETELRRALAVSEGDLGILVGSPITVTLYLVLVAALVVSALQHLRHRRNDRRVPDAEPEHETV